jgi:glyoxylase-like metal-dependent hydrolase (beta-lactamase superfamily II)
MAGQSGNSYALVDSGSALLVDPVGEWDHRSLLKTGASSVEAVLLTRPSAERLECNRGWGCPFHLPAAAAPLLAADALASRLRPGLRLPVSPFYDPPRSLPGGLVFDLCEGREFRWRDRVFYFLQTPGHTEAALSFLLPRGRGFACFCGDSLSAGGALWKPHHLEWDHWTSNGARTALRGLDRLANLPLSALFPSRGEPVRTSARRAVGRVRRNLEAWALAKEGFCPGVHVQPWGGQAVGHGVSRMLPRLYHLGGSGYMAVGSSRDAVLIDAVPAYSGQVEWLAEKLSISHFTATATHYHCDHADGLGHWRKTLGAKIALAGSVADIVCDPLRRGHLPFLCERLARKPDFKPPKGKGFPVGSLSLAWHSLPGQTFHHDGILVELDGVLVLFSGDNFFFPARYNGTGGCSHANGSTPEDYAASAAKVLRWEPQLVAAGHGAAFRFSRAYFRAVQTWAKTYRKALERLRLAGDSSGYFAPRRSASTE